MEPHQSRHLQPLAPTIADRVHLLTQWPDATTRNTAVKDPIGRSLKFYRKTYTVINQHVQRILPFLQV